MTEEQIQRAVIKHLQVRAKPDVLFFHPPNGGYRNKIEAARFKAMGVLAGVSDVLIIHRGMVRGLELKTETGRVRTSQMEFANRLAKAGGIPGLTYGLDQALALLDTWGLMR